MKTLFISFAWVGKYKGDGKMFQGFDNGIITADFEPDPQDMLDQMTQYANEKVGEEQGLKAVMVTILNWKDVTGHIIMLDS